MFFETAAVDWWAILLRDLKSSRRMYFTTGASSSLIMQITSLPSFLRGHVWRRVLLEGDSSDRKGTHSFNLVAITQGGGTAKSQLCLSFNKVTFLLHSKIDSTIMFRTGDAPSNILSGLRHNLAN